MKPKTKVNYWLTREVIEREKLLDKTIAQCEAEYRSMYKATSKKVITDYVLIITR